MEEQRVKETYHQEDDILLKDIVLFLLANIWTIIAITALVTTISIIYVFRITPTYEAEIMIYPPSDLAVSKINHARVRNVDLLPSSERNYSDENIYEMVLYKISSNSFKKQVFISNNYSEKLNLSNGMNDSSYIKGIKEHDKSLRDYARYTLKGQDPLIMSSFLNDLVESAKSETLNDIKTIEQSEIDTRIDELDSKLIIEINKLKEARIKNINALKQQLSIAKSLKYKESNFSQNLRDSDLIPKWYTYGEEALLEEIDRLALDKTYNSPESMLWKAQRDQLASIGSPDLNDIELVDVIWSSPPGSPIDPKRRLFVVTVFSISLLISIFIAYLISVMREK